MIQVCLLFKTPHIPVLVIQSLALTKLKTIYFNCFSIIFPIIEKILPKPYFNYAVFNNMFYSTLQTFPFPSTSSVNLIFYFILFKGYSSGRRKTSNFKYSR